MPTFEYIAIDGAGVRVTGVLAGASEQVIVGELEARRLTPVSVRAKRDRRPLLSRVPARSVGASYQQLADLLGAGVPLMRSLRILGRGQASERLAGVYREIAEQVGQGAELGDAMAARPDVFAPVHVAMVRAGERGGFLEQVFERLSKFVLGQAELRSRVMGAMVYPLFLVGAGAVVLSVIFAFFVPKFRTQFERLDELPVVTRLVLGLSDALTRFAPATLAVLLLAAAGAWWWAQRPESLRRLNVWRTRAPVIGPITRSLAVARFCRMLGTMEANGVPLLDALRIARGAAGNVLLEGAIDHATESVRAGRTLAEPLGESGLFDEDVVEMIAVGESAGNVDQVLLRTADTVEERIDRLLTVAIRLVEPVLLALIAAVIGLVAAGLVLPMVRLSESV